MPITPPAYAPESGKNATPSPMPSLSSSSGRSWPFWWFFAMCRTSRESGWFLWNRANAPSCSGSAFRSPDRLAWLMPTTNVPGPIPASARSASRSAGGVNRSQGMPWGM